MAGTDGKRRAKKKRAKPKKYIPDLFAVRRALARADFFFGLVEGVSDDYRPEKWNRVLVLAVIDAGQEALTKAIDDLDQILPRQMRT